MDSRKSFDDIKYAREYLWNEWPVIALFIAYFLMISLFFGG